MTSVRKILPFLTWFPLQRQTLTADFWAGLTVALLVIPQSLAYAQLAGVPVQYGLYAALIPTIVGALFGSCGLLSTGPVALTSLLTAASVSQLAPPGADNYVAAAVLLALIAGLIQLAFGLLRMGVLLNFLSYPVLMGFVNAAAIIIGLSQLPSLLGITTSQTEHFLLDIWRVIRNMDETHEASLAFGLITLSLLLIFRKYAPGMPGVLITVAVATLASYVLGYEQTGGHVVGTVPSGLPSVGVPPLDWNLTIALLPAGFVIALVSFMEAMSSCKIIAIKTRTSWSENQELLGQGLAKIAGAFSHSIPVSGSFSRSALNLAAGARTGVSSLVSAFFVLLTLLFLTPLLHHLPKPTLAAIIIVALLQLVDITSVVKAWRASADDGIAAAVTFIVTLVFAPNIQIGILTGIILSLALLLYRLMRPRVALLGLHPDGALRDARLWNLPELHPELGALRFDGPLIFVNVAYFEDAVLQIAQSQRRLKCILVAAGGINAIDASGVEMLARLVERLRENGIILAFSGIKQQVMVVMAASGLAGTIGGENIFATDMIALDALRERLDTSR